MPVELLACPSWTKFATGGGVRAAAGRAVAVCGGTRARSAALASLIALACFAGAARAESPPSLDEALRLDLKGGSAVRRAFEEYLRAAETGVPEAEFNVGVMLDSGRGVRPDVVQAAVWYARAAAHGNRRAAYNLGQLYEAGEGVPRNQDLARAWFAASDLPAARAHLLALRPRATASMSAPVLVAPAIGVSDVSSSGGFEFIWISESQPEPVRFYLELYALDASGPREVFSAYSDTSSIFVPLAKTDGEFAWRVSAVARQAGRYLASGWSRFEVVSGSRGSAPSHGTEPGPQ